MYPQRRRTFLKRLLGSGGLLTLTGCDRLSSIDSFRRWLQRGGKLNEVAQHALTSATGLVREFPESAISPHFRGNGTLHPETPEYLKLLANDFLNYRLKVTGLVDRPLSLSLETIRQYPARTQITRHDCVEGWSAIGKWKGVPLRTILEEAILKPEARYVVFHCADLLGETNYYESIDLEDARHPQTILAYELNDEPLPIKNGAPLRVRVERQLGYKMAKYILEIEAVEKFDGIEGGKGGYWEDRGYEWYAGI